MEYQQNEYQQNDYQQEEYDENVYEQRDVQEIDVDADRLIAMNPSGVVEKYENQENEGVTEGRRLKCNGDVCILEDDESDVQENFQTISKPTTSYMMYIVYVLIFLILCALGYFGYKKFFCKS
jgi:hypothetical protein